MSSQPSSRTCDLLPPQSKFALDKFRLLRVNGRSQTDLGPRSRQRSKCQGLIHIRPHIHELVQHASHFLYPGPARRLVGGLCCQLPEKDVSFAAADPPLACLRQNKDQHRRPIYHTVAATRYPRAQALSSPPPWPRRVSEDTAGLRAH